MNAKTLFFLAGFVVVFSLIACGNCSKKIDCPGFNDSLLTALFPYTDNQQLIFKSTANESIVFTLKNTKTTEAYQAVGSVERAPSCSAEKDFESVEKDSLKRSLFALVLSTGDLRYALLTINANSLGFNSFTDAGFNVVSINGAAVPVQTIASLSLGNRTFNNVVTAVRDTTSTKFSGLYKIWYTQAEGLVGYAEYPSLKTWVKQ